MSATVVLAGGLYADMGKATRHDEVLSALFTTLEMSISSIDNLYFDVPTLSRPAAVSARWASELRGYDAWSARFQDALGKIEQLSHGWDLNEAPQVTRDASRRSREMLEILWQLELRPARVAPTVDGGIAFSFFASEMFAIAEIGEDGEIAMSVTGPTGLLDARELDSTVELRDAMVEVLSVPAYRQAFADVPLEEAGGREFSS
jgi:hypothetical protein